MSKRSVYDDYLIAALALAKHASATLNEMCPGATRFREVPHDAREAWLATLRKLGRRFKAEEARLAKEVGR